MLTTQNCNVWSKQCIGVRPALEPGGQLPRRCLWAVLPLRPRHAVGTPSYEITADSPGPMGPAHKVRPPRRIRMFSTLRMSGPLMIEGSQSMVLAGRPRASE